MCNTAYGARSHNCKFYRPRERNEPVLHLYRRTLLHYVRTNIHTYIHKYMAQSVEALRYNRKVAGSISEGATGKFH